MRVRCLTCGAHRHLSSNANLDKHHYCWTCGRMRLFQFVPTSMVILSCDKSYYPTDGVKFINISSNELEQDVMTFECPSCGKQHDSLILG